jgi:Ser/Thr protein kinase RdoA (MazF antagonist)
LIEEVSQLVKNNLENLALKNSDYTVRKIEGGENNRIFEIQSDERDLILRLSNQVSEDRISHEAKILNLLEEEGVENVPRKVYFEESKLLDQPVLIETKVGERDISFCEMGEEDLEEFAERLGKIHSITPERFNEKFGREVPNEASMEEHLKENFEKYSKKPFEKYLELAGEADPRVEEMFERQKRIYEEIIQEEKKLPWRMVHGDPAENIRSDGEQIFIIDWEFCRPGVPFFELIYTFRHNSVSEEKREEFLRIYRKFRETSKVAERNAEKWEKFLAFNDMIWAAKRKEKARDRGGDGSKYEGIFEQRMKNIEKLFS